ncbi:MAG: type IV pilus modification PilV family protein [Peptoanaerobacter stomatis]|uniref:type IV pilus modification PilV family protein n=1 Tax=Peptoanaerobacter stomatis TaxID=796937 RepID=UPI003F9ECF7F
MNNKNKGFTLAEMIISVAILSVVSIYILQMFLATKNLSIKSYEIDKSLRISKNIIELVSAGQDIENSEDALLSKMRFEYGAYKLDFDSNFDLANENNKLYTMTMSIKKEDGLNQIDIEFTRLKPYIMKNESNIQISSVSSTKRIQ